MNIVTFDTWERQAEGLQHRTPIEDQTLFVFPFVEGGMLFHSQNVLEPFDLAFLSRDRTVLYLETITPPYQAAIAPEGTFMALESKVGFLRRIGFLPGRRVTF